MAKKPDKSFGKPDQGPAEPSIKMVRDKFPDMVELTGCDSKGENQFLMRVEPKNVVYMRYFTGRIIEVHMATGAVIFCLEDEGAE